VVGATTVADDASEATQRRRVIGALELAGVQLLDSASLFEARDDRRQAAAIYLDKHGIEGLFERLAAALIFHKPEDPRTFLVQEIGRFLCLFVFVLFFCVFILRAKRFVGFVFVGFLFVLF
jgi:hypothetical protein